MARSIAYIMTILAGAAIALVTIHPATTPAVQTPSPVVTTPTLAACHTEDGSGQGLCMWDAQTMGNGMGADVISGECAINSIGITTQAISDLCMRVWSIAPYTKDLGNGASDSWDGPGMVEECSDIEFTAMQDESIRESLDSEGWNMAECLKAMLDNA